MLSQGLEREATKATAARASEQRCRSELNEKNRELDDLVFTNLAAQRELRSQFQQQMQVMRIEITSQHSHELAAERARAGDFEEVIQRERSKYHQLSDDMRRMEETMKMESQAMKEEREKSSKLSMQTSTLSKLRDELREQISELQVRLATTEQTARSTNGHLETKEMTMMGMVEELRELRSFKRKREEEERKEEGKEVEEVEEVEEVAAGGGASATKERERNEGSKEMVMERKEVGDQAKGRVDGRVGISTIDGSSSSSASSSSSSLSSEGGRGGESTGLKVQLKATLQECSMLRSEVQTMRMTIHEKDFRLQALREIVGGLEKMVPPERNVYHR